jgi:hypothetical protein
MNGVSQKVLSLVRAVAQKIPRGTPAFADIAGGTGRYQITERMIALLDPRLHMIDRQVFVGVDLAAIDAAVAVPSKDRRATARCAICSPDRRFHEPSA